MVLRKVETRTRMAEALKHLAPLPVTAISGSEGEGEGEGEKPKPEPKPAATSKTFSEEYVKELRQEAIAAKEKARADAETFQTQITDLSTNLEKYTEGEKTEIEKAQKAATEASESLTSTAAKLRASYLDNAVLTAGTALKFHDPLDAVAHLTIADITFDDDGKPDQAQVTAQLKKVAEEKTYLVMEVSSGDGDGSHRGPAPKPEDAAARIANHKETLKSQGRIMLPT